MGSSSSATVDTAGKSNNLSDELKKKYGADALIDNPSRSPASSTDVAGGKGSNGSADAAGGATVAVPGTTDFTSIGDGSGGNLRLSGSETDAEISKLLAQMKGDVAGKGKLDQAKLAELEKNFPGLAKLLKESGLTPAEQAERLRSLGDATKPLFVRVKESLTKCLKAACVTGKNKLSMF